MQGLGTHDMQYYNVGGVVKTDRVRFFKKKIKIQAERKKYHSFQKILRDSSLKIHHVIERSIMIYYANCTNFPLINSIKVKLECADESQNFNERTNRLSTPQIFSAFLHRDSVNTFLPSGAWFALDKKGKALRISLSYWLEAISTNVTQIKFERAWTAFNTLYTFYGKTGKEAENHKYIKSQIRNNPVSFHDSLHLSATMITTTTRSFRWKIWVLNHIERKGFSILENIMTSITDDRLKQVFSGIFSSVDVTSKFADVGNAVRNATLQRQLNNIQSSLATAGVRNDMDVTLMLCVNYAYFLRNRRFHGGSENSFCKICPTTEDNEFDTISNRLITLVKELYKAEDIIAENSNP